MRWIVTIEGNRPDIERLIDARSRIAAGDDPREAVITFEDAHDVATDTTREAIRREIETALLHINAASKVRWGRSFEGVSLKGTKYESASGQKGQVVFINPAYAHLTPQEFGDMVERLGHPRPPLPFGHADVEALDLAHVTALADRDATVARVLRLVDLMLDGDEDIDWSAAYAALETIEADAGQAHRDWYSRGQRRRFTSTANSIEAVGDLSRHGTPYDSPSNPMNHSEASSFIRGITARWIAWRLSRDAPDG